MGETREETTGRPWDMEERCDLTAKGRAFLIAIDTGLVVPVEGEYRAARFDAFWRRLEAEVLPGLVAGIGWGRRDAAWRSSGSLPAKTARM